MSLTLVYPYGRAATSGRLKSFAEDFRVDEELGFEPSGEGEHLFIQVEKTGLTTSELIDQIADDAGIKACDIGYSGMKDKMAVTRQWLSLRLPVDDRFCVSERARNYAVLKQIRHHRKLRTGTHRFNHFEVCLREVKQFDDKTVAQIRLIKQFGMANYFGQQRFGHSFDNVRQALEVFSSVRKTRRLTRNKRSLYLSALRSELFNQILARRIEANIWQAPAHGDVFMLNGSQSIFNEQINDEILERYRQFDISSTASLYGTGELKPGARALEIEKQVFQKNPDICESILGQKVKLQMRPTRVEVKDFTFDYCEEDNLLQLKAKLPSGSYFTSLLNHFIDTAS